MENGNSSTGQNILIVSDAWEPQVNGVVTTLTNTAKEIQKLGYNLDTLTHLDCDIKWQTPYPDVMFAIPDKKVVKSKISKANAVHISTPEGPIGNKALKYCNKNNIPFSTGYHTKWPEFLNHMFGMPNKITTKFLKHVHKKSKAILVPTLSAKNELVEQGFKNVVVQTRGVNRDQFTFNPEPKDYIVCVSRVSKEKGLDDFCQLPYPNKVLVGDGPYLLELTKKYPEVEFTGVMKGNQLADYYRNARCFVFPSKADTFGVVMIEAMACGTPVAAYPVTGPIDVVDQGQTGWLNEDLFQAVENAIKLDRKNVCEYSQKWTWQSSTQEFVTSLYFI
mgnify:FL=1